MNGLFYIFAVLFGLSPYIIIIHSAWNTDRENRQLEEDENSLARFGLRRKTE